MKLQWQVTGLDDSQLSDSGLHLELHRTEIADRRVPTLGVVEALDVIEHIGFGFVAGPIDLAGDALGLQLGEEALHRSIVPDIAGAAHRAGDAVIGHQSLELIAGVLGGFNRSSQHREVGGCDEGSETSFGPVHAQEASVAGSSARLAA
jgi:hypothetical protein